LMENNNKSQQLPACPLRNWCLKSLGKVIRTGRSNAWMDAL